MATLPPPHLIHRALPVRWAAPAGALVVGALAAALLLAMPDAMLERWAWASGLARLLPAETFPLGAATRGGAALAAALIAAALGWAVLYLLLEPGGLLMPRRTTFAGMPVVRRADAHPDAPPRRPLGAAELGVPMPPRREPVRPSTADRQPVAAFNETPSIAMLMERLEQGMTRRSGDRAAG